MPSLSSSSSVFGRFTGRKQGSEQVQAGAATNAQAEESASSPPLETVAEGVGIEKSKFQHNGARHRRTSSILSLTTSVSDIGHNVRRSASLRSHRTQPSSGSGTFGHKPRFPSSGNTITSPLTASPTEDEEKDLQALPATPATVRTRGKFASVSRTLSHKFKSTDTLPVLTRPDPHEPLPERPPTAIDVSKTPSMLNAPTVPKRAPPDKPALHPQASFTSVASRDISSSHGVSGAPLQHAQTNSGSTAGGYNPQAIYQQIHETSAKRMATIDYVRKVHEGNIYYFSTLHYSPAALQSIPSLHPLKMGRRANNYLVLGNSLPALLDLNSGSAIEYLKALSALLQEFETYQNLSGVDTTGNSLSRGRMGQMFKSGMTLGMGKNRRASTATDAIALPPSGDMLGLPKSNVDPHSPLDISPINASGHDFLHLVTPHLPFEPDFLTTFATLCDTLIDTYARLLDLVSGPEQCSIAVGEAFGKADKAVRKILVANVLREFEDTTRATVKGEVAGLGRLVLGGLM